MGCFVNRKQHPAEAPKPNPDVRELLTPNLGGSLHISAGIAVLAMLPSEFGFPDDRLRSPSVQAIIRSLIG
jgi:hypothetical protein